MSNEQSALGQGKKASEKLDERSVITRLSRLLISPPEPRIEATVIDPESGQRLNAPRVKEEDTFTARFERERQDRDAKAHRYDFLAKLIGEEALAQRIGQYIARPLTNGDYVITFTARSAVTTDDHAQLFAVLTGLYRVVLSILDPEYLCAFGSLLVRRRSVRSIASMSITSRAIRHNRLSVLL